DHAVVAPGDGAQAFSETTHRLVVYRLHRQPRAVEQARETAPRIEPDVVRHRRQLGRAVHDGGPELVGDVRDQVAAERDVQELHAATDAEQRHRAAGDGGTRERQLEAIALLGDAVVGIWV